MRLVAVAFCLSAGLLFSQTQELEQRVTDAHAGLAAPGEAPSSQASRLSEQATRYRPTAGRGGPIEERNFVDRLIFGRIRDDGVPHAGLASDEEFVRRVYLDAVGRIPTRAEASAFLQDSRPDKRDRLIDELLASAGFIDYWSYYWEDLFRGGSRMGPGRSLFHYWVTEWLRLDRPYDEIVRELLTQGGKTSHSSPGALFFARDFVKAKDDPETPDAEDIVNRADALDEFTITYSKAFLGLNLGCISCHDGAHHLEQVNLYLTGKTRQDFFSQAAFFGKTRMVMNWYDGRQKPAEYTVDDVAEGYPIEAESILRVPRWGDPVEPRFILTGEAPKPGADLREELARMIAEHPQFARATANRIWAELMGFGIVEPVDDFDLTRYDSESDLPDGWMRQASNPELLDALAESFRESDFSFRELVRTILRSSAYQLSSSFEGEWKPEYASYYARKFVRMLGPTQLHDAVVTATGLPASYKNGTVKAAYANQLLEPATAPKPAQEFLRAFGQQTRDELPSKATPTAMQAMLLMNSEVVLERVNTDAEDGLLAKILDTAETDEQAVQAVYAATLTRAPQAGEMKVALAAIENNRRRGLEDLQWALINSPEFLFNY